MGGSSKKQTVGYKYYFGIHMGIGRGPCDALHEIRVGDKTAWIGDASGNARIDVNKPDLFGGEGKEGGVQGVFEIMMGEPDQEASTGLKAMLGNVLPGFRGMMTAFYNGLVSVNNPYPKPWKFRLNRTLKGWEGGTPWYASTCRIALNGLSDVNDAIISLDARSRTLRRTKWSLINNPSYGISGYSSGDRLQIDHQAGSTYKAWSDDGGLTWTNTFTVTTDTGAVTTYWPGTYPSADAADAAAVAAGPILLTGSTTYTFTIPGATPELNLGGLSLRVRRELQATYAMNPAHIIYECLTNRVWGRGLSPDRLDMSSFVATANQLYAENFGLCMKWTRKDTIENFVQGVIDHIGGTIYVSRTTKLYTLKLIRADYVFNDLPVFDTESGILNISDATVASIGSSVNAVEVKYHDWVTDEDRTVAVKNSAAIVAAGGVVNQVSRDFTGIPVPQLALQVAQRELRAVSTSLRKFTVVMDRRGEDFQSGDVFAIQDPKRGIPKMAVRVGRVDDGTLTDGKITLTVVQDVFSFPTTTMSADVPSTWTPPSTKPCIDQQRVIEAPYFLMARNMTPAELDYVSPDGGYITTLNSRGQPLNQSYMIAVRPDAPTPDDAPMDNSYVCE